MTNDEYIGDGVYASYDGYHIWLAANDPGNKSVALEPEAIQRLIKYALKIGSINLNDIKQ